MNRSPLSTVWMAIVSPAKTSSFCVLTPSRRLSTARPSTYGAVMLAAEATASAISPIDMRSR